jgi:DNA-binding GntR family transcriptional regulator
MMWTDPMPNGSSLRSRRAQTLVAVREMVLRCEFTPRRAIEPVELSKALGASRPMLRATLEQLHQEGLLEELSASEYAPRVFSD